MKQDYFEMDKFKLRLRTDCSVLLNSLFSMGILPETIPIQEQDCISRDVAINLVSSKMNSCYLFSNRQLTSFSFTRQQRFLSTVLRS